MDSHEFLNKGFVLRGNTFEYTIKSVLGRGTFGITYLAETYFAGPLGKVPIKVAIKEFYARGIHSRREDGSLVDFAQNSIAGKYQNDFKKEALHLSSLNHPNIVRVLEAFASNNTYYYSMEFIDGISLDTFITQNGSLSIEKALPIINDIGSALTYMHAHNMLHLDIKPKNIMLRNENNIGVLIDFGLSKHFNEQGEAESSTDIGLGTPGYAPIEQGNYSDKRVYPTLDIYAFGATIFKMLTGNTPPVASLIFNEDFPQDELHSHNVPQIYIEAIKLAMSPQYKRRPQTIQNFLRLFSDTENTQIESPEVIARRMEERKRKEEENRRRKEEEERKRKEEENRRRKEEEERKRKEEENRRQKEEEDRKRKEEENRRRKEEEERKRKEEENRRQKEEEERKRKEEENRRRKEEEKIHRQEEKRKRKEKQLLDKANKKSERHQRVSNYIKRTQRGIRANIVYILIAVLFISVMVYVPQRFIKTGAKTFVIDADTTVTIAGIRYPFVLIKGGTFTMGQSESRFAMDNEHPHHEVTLSDFYISPIEVTCGLWRSVMGEDRFTRGVEDNFPVAGINYDDCVSFIMKLNEHTGLNFTLPTEAQWEYAATGGEKHEPYEYSGSQNLNSVAWYLQNSTKKTHLVAQKKPNSLGLYDMSGNVSEWCLDYYDKYENVSQTNPSGPVAGSLKIIRGGDALSPDYNCRNTRRNAGLKSRKNLTGLRLVLNNEGSSIKYLAYPPKNNAVKTNGKSVRKVDIPKETTTHEQDNATEYRISFKREKYSLRPTQGISMVNEIQIDPSSISNIDWKVSNTQVCKIDEDGWLIAKEKGTTTIYAHISLIDADPVVLSTSVSVNITIEAEKLIVPETVHIKVGEKIELPMQFLPEGASKVTVAAGLNKEGIITFDGTTITGISKGSVMIQLFPNGLDEVSTQVFVE